MGIEKNPADFLPSDVEAVVASEWNYAAMVTIGNQSHGQYFWLGSRVLQDSAFFHAEQTSVRQRVFY